MENQNEEIKVLVACECSGTVRDTFYWAGFDAWSCDIKPADTPTNRHLQMDVREALKLQDWDMLIIAHPPCTRLCNSGVRWLHEPPTGKSKLDMWADLDDGAALFREMMDADVPYICVENPVMHKYAKEKIWGDNYEKDCVNDGTFERTTVQPWHFAQDVDAEDNVKKMTHLWLKGLPALKRTGDLTAETARDDIHKCPPSDERAAIRSKFHQGIADAMAEQWAPIINNQRAAA